jgi:PilZ domain
MMAAAIARLISADDRLSSYTRPKTRRVTRRPVKVAVTVSTAGGESMIALIADISTHGCNIKSDTAWLRAGAFISIRLGEDAPIQAIVRWVRNGASGVEFLRPVADDQMEWRASIEAQENW